MSGAATSFLVTGTWGVGKTKVLELLAKEYSIVEEPGRRIARAAGEFDPERFTHSVTNITVKAHLLPLERGGVSVFDRGVVDCLAYARWFGLDEGPYRRYVARFRYHKDAFFFPFWPEIYTTDAERRATPEMAATFEAVLAEVLAESGYDAIHVPKTGAEARASFLRDELNRRI